MHSDVDTRVREALASAQQAIDRGGGTTLNYLRLAHALRAAKRWPEVEAAVESARGVADDAAAWTLIGDFCTQLEDYPRAGAAYDEAARRAPANARILFNRAAVRRFLGELDAAERDYDRVIELDPRDGEAWLNRTRMRTQGPDRNHIPELEQLLGRGLDSWQREVPIRFALAKEYEDIGEYRRSWDHLKDGAALRRRHLRYDVAKDLATVDWIIEAYPMHPGSAGTQAGCPSAEPIFIVGMPRTGTTLLERIIAGHPDVFGAGELMHYAAALIAAAARKAGRADLPRRELVAASATVDFAALGADYLERTRPRTGGHARFTDKMPLNYLYCGSIARALPKARILHLTRHPLATIYAVYKTLFNQGYPFSYDLDEIADYYIGYRRLMDHWRLALPDRILDVSYEQLVSAPEPEGRRVFDFLGLEWRPECLAFHERSDATATASAAQVRQPIYRTSIDQWKNYQSELEPVAERLRAAGLSL
ncbi:MAG: tetratricopeptide repeat-containing sulfotransferase family protein [Steroidobacteraceae bacterium]